MLPHARNTQYRAFARDLSKISRQYKVAEWGFAPVGYDVEQWVLVQEIEIFNEEWAVENGFVLTDEGEAFVARHEEQTS